MYIRARTNKGKQVAENPVYPEELGAAVQEAIVGAYDAGASQALRDMVSILTDMIDGPYSQRDDGLRFAIRLIRDYEAGASWSEATRRVVTEDKLSGRRNTIHVDSRPGV